MWTDYLLEAGMGILFGILRDAPKDPHKRDKIKAVCLKLARTIETVFGNDPDFQAIKPVPSTDTPATV